MLNTEWLLSRPSLGGSKECQVGDHIIYQLGQKIEALPPFYTVVTVMHRSPQELDWKEKNVSNINRINAYNKLMEYSDILISGHNHHYKTLQADCLWNQVQHFQVGSLSCSHDKGDHSYPYSASLMKIDSLRDKISLLHMTYNINARNSAYWNISLDNQITYPLRGHINLNSTSTTSADYFGNIEKIRVKRNSEKEIINVILSRFYHTCPRQLNEKEYEWLPIGMEKKVKITILPLSEYETKKKDSILGEFSNTLEHVIVYSTNPQDIREFVKLKQENKIIAMNNRIITPVLILKLAAND